MAKAIADNTNLRMSYPSSKKMVFVNHVLSTIATSGHLRSANCKTF